MTGASLRNVLGHAKRLRIALRAAEPLCVLRNVPEGSPRHAPGFPAFTALRSAWAEDLVVGNTCPGRCFAALPRKARRFGASGGCGCCSGLSPSLFRGFAAKGALLWDGWGTWLLRQLIPATNYPWHTCAKVYWCYTCNCCFRAGWNSPLAVNRAVPKGCCGAGEVPAAEPMSPRPVCALVRMPAELVRSQYQRLESG